MPKQIDYVREAVYLHQAIDNRLRVLGSAKVEIFYRADDVEVKVVDIDDKPRSYRVQYGHALFDGCVIERPPKPVPTIKPLAEEPNWLEVE
jgi:hypothetical protein